MYQLNIGNFFPNGDGEIRTHDPLLARQVLSQLSYTPVSHRNRPLAILFPTTFEGSGRVEPLFPADCRV